MNIILLGPPGCGKGTQAKLLSEHYGWKHISSGQLVRAALHQNDPHARAYEKHIHEGKLLPDTYVTKLVKTAMDESNIFDGFPRTITQAHSLDLFAHIDLVIEISLTDEQIIERLSKRRECPNCSAIFGEHNQPKKKDTCDICHGKLVQRDDDKPDTIKKRLEFYRDETEPLLEYYRPRSIVHSIDGSTTIKKVFSSIHNLIEHSVE